MTPDAEKMFQKMAEDLAQIFPNHPLAALPFAISKDEAVELLADEEWIETRWEARPNNGRTIVQKMHVIAARLSIRACVSVARSGPEAQELGFGIHVRAEMPELGMGILFFKTKPEKRVSDEELAREREAVNE